MTPGDCRACIRSREGDPVIIPWVPYGSIRETVREFEAPDPLPGVSGWDACIGYPGNRTLPAGVHPRGVPIERRFYQGRECRNGFRDPAARSADLTASQSGHRDGIEVAGASASRGARG